MIAHLSSVRVPPLASHLSFHDGVGPVLLDVTNALPQRMQAGPVVTMQLAEHLHHDTLEAKMYQDEQASQCWDRPSAEVKAAH